MLAYLGDLFFVLLYNLQWNKIVSPPVLCIVFVVSLDLLYYIDSIEHFVFVCVLLRAIYYDAIHHILAYISVNKMLLNIYVCRLGAYLCRVFCIFVL